MTNKRFDRIIAIVLAAGRSTRMGDVNKLLTPWQGKPLVVHVVDAALAVEDLSEVAVVTGHQAGAVEALLADGITPVHNPDYATGMASSLKAGIAWAKRRQADAVLVLLGDMPLISSLQIEQILAAHAETGNQAIVQATNQGKPGNPVLLPGSLFDDILQVEGDRGARSVIAAHRDQVVSVEIGDAAARDFDTPEAFANPDI